MDLRGEHVLLRPVRDDDVPALAAMFADESVAAWWVGFDDNGRAIACYGKVGFKPVGVLRRNERGPGGTYRDALLMDLLAEELL